MKKIWIAVVLVVFMGICFAAVTGHWHKPVTGAAGPRMTWVPYTQAALKAAEAARKPVLIDFYAEWCPGCHQLDETVFSDPTVAARLAGYTALRMDATGMNSPEVQAVLEQYGILGLPTVVFLDEHGHEIKKARVEGAWSLEDFQETLDALAKK